MKKPVKIALFAAGLLVAATAVTACGSSNSSADTITLYNAQHQQTTDALIKEFTKETGIKVRVKNDEEDVLTAQIEQEGANSPADVVYTENSNWLQQLDDAHLLATLDPATLANAPSYDNAADSTWAGVSARVSGMVYNASQVESAQLPTSIMQLADPQWKDKIELSPTETDFWPVIASVEKAKGESATLAWLRGIKANAGKNANVPDNETLVSDIAQGHAAIGLVNHYYFYRGLADAGQGTFNARFGYFAPRDPGYVEGVSGAAVLKSSKKQAQAQRFVAFLTGESGQQVIASGDSFEYPLNPRVNPNPQLMPIDQLQPTDFRPSDLGTGENAKSLLQQAGLL